jgi:flagellar L-ring protein precursor FlgH
MQIENMQIDPKRIFAMIGIAALLVQPAWSKKPPKKEDTTALDQYLAEVNKSVKQLAVMSPGSTYVAGGRLAEGLRDLRASQIFDLVYIVVSDKASAVSSGVTNTDRKSSLNTSITALAGPTKATGALANLAKVGGETQIQGKGTTSRDNTLTTTLTAEVIAVLPNGNLVVQGQKDILVNSERQVVTVRGIVRPDDLSPTNSIPSDRLARLEIHVNGKGVIEDAVKRPFILYRVLLGLLPF